MKVFGIVFAGLAIAVCGERMSARADDAVIDTQQVILALVGEWELAPKSDDQFKQRLNLNGGTCVCGIWLQTDKTLPTSITYYVEGNELLLQYYHEPNRVGNYRLKQLRFSYKLDGDVLTLTRDDVSDTWKRIKRTSIAK